MPEANADRNEAVAGACGCGPAKGAMAMAKCCGEQEPERNPSVEEGTTRENGGA